MSAESLANRLKSDLPWKVINYVRSIRMLEGCHLLKKKEEEISSRICNLAAYFWSL